MIVDTSVIVSMLRREPGADEFDKMVGSTAHPKMSTASYFEAATVLDSARDPFVSRKLDELVRTGRIELVPVSVRQAYIAREAYRDFGKGSGHPARLNFGDCFAYALAQELDEPLLFKGDDFTHTDLKFAR